MCGPDQITIIPHLPIPIYRNQGQYQINDLFVPQTQRQGVPGRQYTMVDNTNTGNYILAGMYLGI